MASRKETEERRQALHAELRQACLDGSLPAGELLPPMRDLAERFAVSQRIVHEALRQLTGEGLLFAVPRVGTFVGRPRTAQSDPFLFLTRQPARDHVLVAQMQNGFEDRIAQLGGISDTLSKAEALLHVEQGDLPAVRGVFIFEVPLCEQLNTPVFRDVPSVVYSSFNHLHLPTADEHPDTVGWDDEDGGVQATRHLLAIGHRQIAFLGINGEESMRGYYAWSRGREAGWQRAMEVAGQETQGLAFDSTVSSFVPAEQLVRQARDAAAELLRRPGISAVIAANFHASYGLLEALRATGIASVNWPAIVCFDETPQSRASGLTYLRLPWEKVGAEAAQLLWDRANGRLAGPPQSRLVSMNLIPRLTCRPQWAKASHSALRRVGNLASIMRETEALEAAA